MRKLELTEEQQQKLNDRDWLRKQHIYESRTLKEIAISLKLPQHIVRNAFKSFNIKVEKGRPLTLKTLRGY